MLLTGHTVNSMPDEDDIGGLGPLPKTDRNAELQRLSFKALQAVLPADRFVFRDERAEDAGVDASVELLASSGGVSGSTNLRAQVQLKGTDSAEVNADGSISLQIKVSNLNYLLNGPSPLFVVYVAPRDELRFAWAYDERRRLDASNPEWMRQGSVTIRFVDRLTTEALEGIYERIMREGRMHRRVHDTLANASLSEQVVIGIDPETLATTGPEEAARLLLRSGLTLVSAGLAVAVLDHARLLDRTTARAPRLQLVQAYAEFNRARYQAALAHLQEAALGQEELTPSDRHFLLYLCHACEFYAGRIDLEEYSRRVADWEESGSGGFALAHRLDALRYRLLKELDMKRRAELLDELRAAVTEVLRSAGEQKAFKLQARLTLIHAEGGQVASRFLQQLFRLKIRQGLQLATDVRALREKLVEEWEGWERSVNDALAEAEAEGHPLLIAFALDTRAVIRIVLLSQIKLFASSSEVLTVVPEVLFQETASDVERAKNIYVRASHLEGELRATLHMADLHLLADRQQEAQDLAHEVLPKAQAMGYSTLEELAREHLAGQAVFSRLEGEVRRRSTDDEDFRLAAETDERLREFAREVMEESGLPAERFPVLLRDVFSERDISQERLHWCRHIELIQNLRHTDHPATFYRTDPERYCRCPKYGYKSAVGHPDWKSVIAAFKQAYCIGCLGRDPKVKASCPTGRSVNHDS